jgi:hypothetical protein
MSEMMSAPIIVSLLREPVARAISHIKHRARGADVALYLAALNEGRLPVPDNVMTRFLGGTVEPMLAGHNHLDFRDREIANRAALLESALERLELITCLGLVERMDLFAESLRAQGICIEIGRENVVPVEMDLDDAQIATIRAHNDLDIQLYQAAQAKLTH